MPLPSTLVHLLFFAYHAHILHRSFTVLVERFGSPCHSGRSRAIGAGYNGIASMANIDDDGKAVLMCECVFLD
jgi:hypothetical protein